MTNRKFVESLSKIPSMPGDKEHQAENAATGLRVGILEEVT